MEKTVTSNTGKVIFAAVSASSTLAGAARAAQSTEKQPQLIPVYRSQEVWTGLTIGSDGRVLVEYPHLGGSGRDGHEGQSPRAIERP